MQINPPGRDSPGDRDSDFKTPSHVVAAAHRGARDDANRYVPKAALGLGEPSDPSRMTDQGQIFSVRRCAVVPIRRRW